MEQAGLVGKVAVVTGAGRGIGAAIASGYAEAGATVYCAARSSAEVDRVASEISDASGSAIACVLDVRDEASVARLFERVGEEQGGLDLLVLNAGVYVAAEVESSEPEAWKDTVETNLIGPYLCARAGIPLIRARRGKIITIGSGLGRRGRPGTSAYSCSKAGLSMLTRVLAQELAKDGVSVNELVPGPVDTTLPSTRTASGRSSLGESEWVKEPRDVVPLALFLATQPQVGPTAQTFSLMRRDG